MYSFYEDVYKRIMLLQDNIPVAVLKELKGYNFIRENIIRELKSEFTFTRKVQKFNIRRIIEYASYTVFVCTVIWSLYMMLSPRTHG